MELITPPPVSNIILRAGQLEQGGVICELGRYGACVWNQDTRQIIYNEDAGYLLRTKGDQSEEGGVAAGFGCMDSCNNEAHLFVPHAILCTCTLRELKFRGCRRNLMPQACYRAH